MTGGGLERPAGTSDIAGTSGAAERSARAALLRSVDVFAGLPESALDALLGVTIPRRFPSGALLFCEGDRGGSLLVLSAGTISIFRTSPSGERAVLAVLRPPEVLGELALLDGGPRSASAEATAPTTVLAIRRDAFLHLLQTQPALVEPLMQHLGGMIRRLSEQTADHVFLDLGGRVAKALLRLAAGSGGRTPTSVVTLTQGRIADLVGGSRQSVNAVLGGLAERGMLRIEGRTIVLLNEPALLRRAGLPPTPAPRSPAQSPHRG